MRYYKSRRGPRRGRPYRSHTQTSNLNFLGHATTIPLPLLPWEHRHPKYHTPTPLPEHHDGPPHHRPCPPRLRPRRAGLHLLRVRVRRRLPLLRLRREFLRRMPPSFLPCPLPPPARIKGQRQRSEQRVSDPLPRLPSRSTVSCRQRGLRRHLPDPGPRGRHLRIHQLPVHQLLRRPGAHRVRCHPVEWEWVMWTSSGGRAAERVPPGRSGVGWWFFRFF